MGALRRAYRISHAIQSSIWVVMTRARPFLRLTDRRALSLANERCFVISLVGHAWGVGPWTWGIFEVFVVLAARH